jgi:hypothetical protein
MSFDEGKITFQEADRRYAKLRREQESGSLGDEEFDAELKQLMVQDPEGRWWAKSRTAGEWHYHDGMAWVKDTPPGYQASQAASADQPETEQPESRDSQEQARRVAWGVLAFLTIPPVVIAIVAAIVYVISLITR